MLIKKSFDLNREFD